MELKTDQPTDMGRHAALVATGILLSRITGLVRDRVFAHYFGNSEAADAFRAAFCIPNFLQMRYAILRVFLTTLLGYLFALPLPTVLGMDPRWGVAGLTVSAGICGWLELVLLRNSMIRGIGKTGLPAPFILKLWISAGAAAASGWAGKLMMGVNHPIALAIVSLGMYGVVYFAVAITFRLPEVQGLIHKVTGFIRFLRGPGK